MQVDTVSAHASATAAAAAACSRTGKGRTASDQAQQDNVDCTARTAESLAQVGAKLLETEAAHSKDRCFGTSRVRVALVDVRNQLASTGYCFVEAQN